MNKLPCVYIMASNRNGALYTGVTSNLVVRVWQHKEGIYEGYSKQHGTTMLVWYESHATMESAIAREKTIKRWSRQWKMDAIERMNPEWKDLYPSLLGEKDQP